MDTSPLSPAVYETFGDRLDFDWRALMGFDTDLRRKFQAQEKGSVKLLSPAKNHFTNQEFLC
jgi:hypothetical protein